jgi:hypothetical protein
MSGMVAELETLLARDDKSAQISYLWDKYSRQRQEKMKESAELRNYIFATSIDSTSTGGLPWKNRTHIPKLCQIRDNLFSNYISALFPNDKWLRWEAGNADSALLEKARAIEGYVRAKIKASSFRETASRLVLDYIDYGNAFAKVEYDRDYTILRDGTQVANYIGPVLVRIHPNDIVFNNSAATFEETFKIVRSVKTIGEIKELAERTPDNEWLKMAIAKYEMIRNKSPLIGVDDWEKVEAYEIEGFGSLMEYYQSGVVEILQFYGDFHDQATGELHRNRVITVLNRSVVVEDKEFDSWLGNSGIHHVGWRLRPDNLYAMGPLDNLVGMQYRIDHLENAKADAMDLAIAPPLVIKGEVERFHYGPHSVIHIDEAGSVEELGRNLNAVVMADNNIAAMEAKMDNLAGAPQEAMGIRTPGEKTAFEVGQLHTAAGRIFQEKVNALELFLEKLLNDFLAAGRQYMVAGDTIKIYDDTIKAEIFASVTKEDITAKGVLRPIGARHFATQAQLMQNLNGLFNSRVGEMIQPHVSSVKMAELIEQVLELYPDQLVKENVGISEQMESQRFAAQAQENNIAEMETMPPDMGIPQ